ncbi:hypothetical protein TNCV_5085551 [Trichonephila clavipes]|uniref:Uncharacterized protein n=1 Tax=Trichonephila clavipes TaxID=2585209 RepID=A0A8X6VIM0_TRICX|nr:hypothetical protein TNCV_5085551 [Trichonephila clavipes]
MPCGHFTLLKMASNGMRGHRIMRNRLNLCERAVAARSITSLRTICLLSWVVVQRVPMLHGVTINIHRTLSFLVWLIERKRGGNSSTNMGGTELNRIVTCMVLKATDNDRRRTATAGSDVVQSGRPIFDDFFQHLWPYIGNNTANVVFQMVKRLWLIRIDH